MLRVGLRSSKFPCRSFLESSHHSFGDFVLRQTLLTTEYIRIIIQGSNIRRLSMYESLVIWTVERIGSWCCCVLMKQRLEFEEII
jgi:hypothetical protein